MIDKRIQPYMEYLTRDDIDLIYQAVVYLSENIHDAENQLDVEIDSRKLDLLFAKLELDHEYLADKL